MTLPLRYRPRWFRKYNFLLSAALDGGTQVMVFVYSFAVGGASGTAISMPNWALVNIQNELNHDICLLCETHRTQSEIQTIAIVSQVDLMDICLDIIITPKRCIQIYVGTSKRRPKCRVTVSQPLPVFVRTPVCYIWTYLLLSSSLDNINYISLPVIMLYSYTTVLSLTCCVPLISVSLLTPTASMVSSCKSLQCHLRTKIYGRVAKYSISLPLPPPHFSLYCM